MNPTNIEWLLPQYNNGRRGFTWNPVVGCTPISVGCANCYAKRLHDKRYAAYRAGKTLATCYAKPFEIAQFMHERIMQPFRRKTESTVFVCSMSDLFGPGVSDETIDQVWAAMWFSPWHTFVVLTKRAKRAHEWLRQREDPTRGVEHLLGIVNQDNEYVYQWPAVNIALGVSVSTQAEWDQKVPLLLECPARWRFVSIEPMLEAIDVRRHVSELNGIILGGESGPGARPMRPDWARGVRDQCEAAHVPLFFKQMKVSGRMVKMPKIDGVEYSIVPWAEA